jgi:hypothetical protein
MISFVGLLSVSCSILPKVLPDSAIRTERGSAFESAAILEYLSEMGKASKI